jgi:hypothetical protein
LTRFQPPEKAKEISVPPHECIGPHNGRELAPFDEPGEQDECHARGVIRSPRSDLTFDVTRELLPEEQILGRQLRSGPEHEPQQAQQVSDEGERRSEHVRR